MAVRFFSVRFRVAAPGFRGSVTHVTENPVPGGYFCARIGVRASVRRKIRARAGAPATKRQTCNRSSESLSCYWGACCRWHPPARTTCGPIPGFRRPPRGRFSASVARSTTMRRAGRAFVKAATTGWSSASWTPRARRFPTSRGATTPPPRRGVAHLSRNARQPPCGGVFLLADPL